MDVKSEKMLELLERGCAHKEDGRVMNFKTGGSLVDQLNNSRWISVKDRLPEIYTQVLCFTGTSVQIAMYEGNDRWFTNYHSYTHEGKNLFTHWMPLPEPPKGE